MLFLGRDTVYASPSPVVALVNVLENSGSLGLVNFRGVNRRQSLIQDFLNGNPYLGPVLLPLAPVEN